MNITKNETSINNEEKIRLSYSRTKTFLHCQREYYYSYILHLKPKDKSKALMLGDVVHRMLHLYNLNQLTPDTFKNLDEYIQELYPNNDEELSYEIALEAANLIQGYLQYFKKEPLNIISSEFQIETPLPFCTLMGKVDALLRDENDALWRVEHKTASRVDNAYLNGLKKGLQGTIYDYLLKTQFEEPIKGTVYNMLIKTKIPKFQREYVPYVPRDEELMLETLGGVAYDITRKGINQNNYYPSLDCFTYNRVCDYKTLCNYDCEENRKAFYLVDLEH